MWWLTNARHVATRGHWPEWYGLGGLMACLRCVRGGKGSPLLTVRRKPRHMFLPA